MRPRVDPVSPPRLDYADYLERQNAIDRRVDVPTIPYSDYLRSQPARPKPAAPCEPPACRDPRRDSAPCPPEGALTLGLKLANIPPPRTVRRELEVRTTYRVEVPLTSGRLIDVVM